MNESKSKENKTGVIYCRVSSKEQVDGTSLESQERHCREYATKQGISVLEVFIEKGESAKTADRTEFSKAIAFCCKAKNKVGCFIVYKIDRFARNQDDHSIVRSNLKRYGTELRSVTEPIDGSAQGRLMESVISGVAEFDNSIRTERTITGMKERLRQGIWVWSAPLGYYRPYEASNLEIEPNTAPLIRLAFEEYAKGNHSYKSLANFLAQRGLRTKHGKIPLPQSVEKILKNPLYCGVIEVWGETHQASFEPLISQELFYKCQRGYKGKARFIKRGLQNPDFPLRRVVICDTCKSSITGSFSKGRKEKYPYYHHQKQGCPKAKFIARKDFEKGFIKFLEKVSPASRFERTFTAIMLDIWKTNYEKFNEESRRIRKEINQLEQDRQKIFDLQRIGVYSVEEFLQQKDRINQTIQEKMVLFEDTKIEEFNMDEALTYCFKFVRDSARTWLKLGAHSDLRLRFQKNILEEKIGFDGEKFGTAKLSPIYELSQRTAGETSNLVPLTGFEPVFPP